MVSGTDAVYRIIDVPARSSQQLEQLGTKPKFWYVSDGRLSLFKQGRPQTGEDWAEKVCCEICQEIGLPHAAYDLATHSGTRGVTTPTFVPPDGELILGNQLLARVFADHETGRRYSRRTHTVGRIQQVLAREDLAPPLGWQVPEPLSGAGGVFLGYLMLDALVGNQDRHDENWGVVRSSGRLYLAPTFDHASSLGRNETDARRREGLDTKDVGRSIGRYVLKAKSALYLRPSEPRPLGTIEAFRSFAAEVDQSASQYWLRRLADIRSERYAEILDEVPADWMSGTAKEFALRMLVLNSERLLSGE
jgi:hypothetical protein